MSNHTRTDLVGCSIRCSVGEPWDFSSDAGPNLLEGVVLQVSEPLSAREWIYCRVSAFRHADAKIEHVVAVPRYERQQSLHELVVGNRIVVNFLFDLSGSEGDGSAVDLWLDKGIFAFLVGSIERAEI